MLILAGEIDMTRFRYLRMKRGYSQEEFRRLYNKRYDRNYTAAAVSMIEHGRRMPELGALMDFADFYGVSLDYLLGRENAGKKDQMSFQLQLMAEKLEYVPIDSECNNKCNNECNDESEEMQQVRENMKMLKCLLEQSAVLARRMEKYK